MPDALDRIVIVGTSGSGKTTLAAELAGLLDLAHFDIDELHWGPNWTPKPTEEFHRRLIEAAAGDRWVTTGNYGQIRDLLWPRATTILWLNYRFTTVFSRVLRRTLRRIATGETVCNGNRESFRKAFLSHDSILLWTISTFRRNRLRYAQLRAERTYSQLEWLEFRSPNETMSFLASLSVSTPAADHR